MCMRLLGDEKVYYRSCEEGKDQDGDEENWSNVTDWHDGHHYKQIERYLRISQNYTLRLFIFFVSIKGSIPLILGHPDFHAFSRDFYLSEVFPLVPYEQT